MKYIASVDNQEFRIDINREGEVVVNGVLHTVDMRSIDHGKLYSLLMDGKSYDIFIDEQDEKYVLVMSDGLFEVTVEDERTRRLAGLRRKPVAPSGEVLIKAPMPGIVVAIPVAKGRAVDASDVVLVLESMKMQNEFRSPRAGVVQSVRVKVGQRVEHNQIMVTIV